MARGRFSNGAFNLLSMFRRSSRRSKFAEEVQPAFDSDTRAFSILPLSSYKKDEDHDAAEHATAPEMPKARQYQVNQQEGVVASFLMQASLRAAFPAAADGPAGGA